MRDDNPFDFSDITEDELRLVIADLYGDIFTHQVILGMSAVPKEWHRKANELLEKYRPVTDKIQAIIDSQEPMA
jgi:hypothetical protein